MPDKDQARQERWERLSDDNVLPNASDLVDANKDIEVAQKVLEAAHKVGILSDICLRCKELREQIHLHAGDTSSLEGEMIENEGRYESDLKVWVDKNKCLTDHIGSLIFEQENQESHHSDDIDCSRINEARLKNKIVQLEDTIKILRDRELLSRSDWIGCEGQPNINLADTIDFCLSDNGKCLYFYSIRGGLEGVPRTWIFETAEKCSQVLSEIEKYCVHMITVDKNNEQDHARIKMKKFIKDNVKPNTDGSTIDQSIV